MINSYYLEPEYDGRASFYHKAIVEDWGNCKTLYSYGTRVSRITKLVDEGMRFVEVYGLWSNTTTRHIKEFLLQNAVHNVGTDELSIIISERGAYI